MLVMLDVDPEVALRTGSHVELGPPGPEPIRPGAPEWRLYPK